MRPSHLHLSAAAGPWGLENLLLPLLMTQLWGEAGAGLGGRRRTPGAMAEWALITKPRTLLLPLGPQRSPTDPEKPSPKSDPPLF